MKVDTKVVDVRSTMQGEQVQMGVRKDDMPHLMDVVPVYVAPEAVKPDLDVTLRDNAGRFSQGRPGSKRGKDGRFTR